MTIITHRERQTEPQSLFQEEEEEVSLDRRDLQDLHPRLAHHDTHRDVEGAGGGISL